MPSSILPRASSNRRRGALLWAGVIAAPVLWLALLQTNYVLAYPTCAARSNTWLYISSGVALGLMVLLALGVRHIWRTDPPEQRAGAGRIGEQRDAVGEDASAAARHFVTVVAVFTTGLCLLLVIGTALPPFILRPCD